MEILMNVGKFFIGMACIIVWTTLMGLLFSKIGPKKIRRKQLNVVDTISIAGIGFFCSLIAALFLILAPKMGLGDLQISGIFSTALLGHADGFGAHLIGRVAAVTFGILFSFIYGKFFFSKIELTPYLKGPLFGLVMFVLAAAIIFPVVAMLPGLQSQSLAVPAFFGAQAGGVDPILTFMAAMVVFGALMGGIYSGWDEA